MKHKILLPLLTCGILTSGVIAQNGAIVRQEVIGGSAYDELRCTLKTNDGGTICCTVQRIFLLQHSQLKLTAYEQQLKRK